MTGYTHWAYFKNKEQAEACKAELSDYLTRLDGPTDYRTDWLLRAAHDIPENYPEDWRDKVKNIVDRNGGEYDGGEMTFGVTESGWVSIPDPALVEVRDFEGKDEEA